MKNSGLNPVMGYVVPFAVFMAFLVIRSAYALPIALDESMRIAVVGAVIVFFSGRLLRERPAQPFGSLLLGAVTFAIWVAPDVIAPGYRDTVFFRNVLTGSPPPIPSELQAPSPWLLISRSARAVIIVPIAEELFWRGWVMRWLIDSNFTNVALGTYQRFSFWITAALFASEHGAYWDVGLIAGLLFNAWMVRTRNLSDLILAHSAANACLSAYVIAFHKWEYWF